MDRKKIAVMGLIVVGLGAFAWFNSLPLPSKASGGALDDYWLYGLNGTTGQLFRYDFGADALENVATVYITEGEALTGVEALAYIPGNLSAFGFWSDPSDGLSKLLYVNTKTGKASIVGQDLGEGKITAATSALPTSSGVTLPVDGEKTSARVKRAHEVYVLQQLPTIDFAIDGGEVIPSQSFAARAEVLGAAITKSGTYDMPVTVQVRAGGDTFEAYGPYGQPVDGTVNDNGNPRSFILPSTYNSGDAISIRGCAWVKTDSGNDGTENSHWEELMSADSATGTQQVLTLRNGDTVPDIDPFQDQGSIVSFIQDYVDTATQTVTLDDNQVIYLFELGTTDLTSSAADFQDLVVLITLAEDPTAFEQGSEMVAYTVVPEGDGVRFEDPKTGLGEDGASETDFFVISATGGSNQVSVTTKANTIEATSELSGIGSEIVDANGFRVTLVGVNNETYTLSVTSETAPYALSHVDFDFGSGSVVVAPVSTYTAVRVAEDSTSSGATAAGQLVQINTKTGSTTQVMVLANEYEALAATTTDQFYASTGTELYLIDPVAGTETLIGTLPQSATSALEFAGSTLYGFASDAQQLIAHNTSTAEGGTVYSVPTSDVASIFFLRRVDEPSTFIGFD